MASPTGASTGGGRPVWYAGIDCGGTFTDLVLADAQRGVHVFKAPSVPGDPARGVLNTLGLAAETLDTGVESILEDCALLVHGSTVATNTVLEGKGARVSLVTTQGFRDSLHIRRGHRENAFEHRTPFRPTLVPAAPAHQGAGTARPGRRARGAAVGAGRAL